MTFYRRCPSFLITAFILPWISGSSISAEPVRDPDGKPANMSKPVQVFILLGQSNMVGAGKVGGEAEGSLTYAVQKKNKYPYLVDDNGNWTVRKDVRFARVMGSGTSKPRKFNNEWMTITSGKIGPEHGIGHAMGQAVDAPVLILKSCIGNRSLGWDLLPPGSKRYEVVEKNKKTNQTKTYVYAGYKDSPAKWEKGTAPKPIGWYAGKQYDGDVANAKSVLAELDQYYPDAIGYEVAGFFFWQGDKDRYDEAYSDRYEQNLVRLIEQLRQDFDTPRAKFVIATLGQTKYGDIGNEGSILNAMLSVDGASGKHPQFKGSVSTLYTNPLSLGGSSNNHYGGNAETYMNVGEAMGQAMVKIFATDEPKQ